MRLIQEDEGMDEAEPCNIKLASIGNKIPDSLGFFGIGSWPVPIAPI